MCSLPSILRVLSVATTEWQRTTTTAAYPSDVFYHDHDFYTVFDTYCCMYVFTSQSGTSTTYASSMDELLGSMMIL